MKRDKREVTYVIGHKNPDTDSICSAIALAELKRAEGVENVTAARAGDINPQTAFVLEYFGVDPPRFLSNVYPRAQDVMTEEMSTVRENTPLFRVMEVIRDKNIRFVPVLDEEDRPKGVLSSLDIAKFHIGQVDTEASRKVFTSFVNIVDTLTAGVATDYLGNEEREFHVYVAAMEEASFLKVLEGGVTENCIVIVGDREGIQRTSVEKGVGLLIVTGGLEVNRSIIDQAKSEGVSVITSPYDSATTALMVRLSRPASRVCNRSFETAFPDEPVEDLRRRLAGSGERGFVVTDKEGRIRGIVTKSNLLKESATSLILVDHNELSQAVDGADRVRIKEVIDHHRLGNFHTSYPITFLCEPVGSTSTLVAELYRQKGVEPARETAGLLLSGVLSDTVLLKSPTVTVRDRAIIPWLEEKAALSYEAFGKELFSASSSLKKRTAEEVIKSDFKIFSAKGHDFGIGQVETIGFEEFSEEKGRLFKELEGVRKEKGLKLSSLLVTDIVAGTSLLLVSAEKEVIFGMDYPRLQENVYELKEVLSRKKQVVPHLLGLFNEIY